MASPADVFTAELRNFSQVLLPNEAVLLHKKVIVEALTRLVQKTPVDTGRARGNWQLSYGSPITEEINRLGVTAGSVIEQELMKLSGLPPWGVAYISNNVAYILVLENGHSDQAPEGMIAVTIQELRGIFP